MRILDFHRSFFFFEIDFEKKPPKTICAFHQPDWTEFIVQKPTPIGQGLSVNHYSEIHTVDAQNSIIATR